MGNKFSQNPILSKEQVGNLFDEEKNKSVEEEKSEFEKLPKVLYFKMFSLLSLKDLSVLLRLNKFFLRLLCSSSNLIDSIWKIHLEKSNLGFQSEMIEKEIEEIKKTPFEEKMNKYSLLCKVKIFLHF